MFMKREFPRWVLWLGVPAIASAWLLATRLVWEQTVWTWKRGEQMVGFSLMHSGIGALLMLAVIASTAWLLVVIGTAVWARNIGGRRLWGMLLVYSAAWVLILTPYGYWQRLFIGKFSPQQSIELMTSAAAIGDTRTVDAFLRAGVPVRHDALPHLPRRGRKRDQSLR
jgi:hypothetical protein